MSSSKAFFHCEKALLSLSDGGTSLQMNLSGSLGGVVAMGIGASAICMSQSRAIAGGLMKNPTGGSIEVVLYIINLHQQTQQCHWGGVPCASFIKYRCTCS